MTVKRKLFRQLSSKRLTSTVDGKKQWMVSYYKTSHLQLMDDHVSGHILKHDEEKKMKYIDFKALLAKEIEKKKT